MKKHILLALSISTALLVASCNSAEEKVTTDENADLVDLVRNPISAAMEDVNPDELPDIKFEKEEHDFGTIQQGEKVQYAFKFKNTGKMDLIITSAQGSCGCTVPNYPKQPLKPGAEATIDVTFDSAGKQGKQNKTVTLITNCIPSTKVLTIMGDVNAPKDGANNEAH
jgi:hypothetical protein